MNLLLRVLLLQSRRLPHLQTRAQRHAWVRARLAYPVPRVRIGVRAPEQQWRFARRSGLAYGTPLEVLRSQDRRLNRLFLIYQLAREAADLERK